MCNDTVYFERREDWRRWLSENFETSQGVWFVFPNKASGKKGILYNDAVEEALCFGWIDSTVKALDRDHKIQRFSPRRAKSPYSQSNKERLRWLSDNEMVHPKVQPHVSEALGEPFRFPDDILDRLREDAAVWENYQRFPEPYRRIRVAYIDSARISDEEFGKRLRNFIDKTRENRLVPGYGGIEKYYFGD